MRSAGKAAAGRFSPSGSWDRRGRPGPPFVGGGRVRDGGLWGHQIQRRPGLIWWWRDGGAWKWVGGRRSVLSCGAGGCGRTKVARAAVAGQRQT